MNSLPGSRVALWDAEPEGVNTLRELLQRRGMSVEELHSLEDVRRRMERNDVDVILVRLSLRSRGSLERLSCLQDRPFAPPVLIVSEAPEVPLYLEAMQRGAFDCLTLPLNENELVRIVSRALETRHMPVAV